jgi:hypothetical protein
MNVLQWLSVGTQVSSNTSVQTVGFEDILQIQKQNVQRFPAHNNKPPTDIIINTMSLTDQEILICRTTPAKEEEAALNHLLDTYQTANVRIVIYGRNSADTSVFVKQDQMRKLGFTHVYVYLGGLFEWLLLQDVYGEDAFPTTGKCVDILKYSTNTK